MTKNRCTKSFLILQNTNEQNFVFKNLAHSTILLLLLKIPNKYKKIEKLCSTLSLPDISDRVYQFSLNPNIIATQPLAGASPDEWFEDEVTLIINLSC
jgi:hypothetical protein